MYTGKPHAPRRAVALGDLALPGMAGRSSPTPQYCAHGAPGLRDEGGGTEKKVGHYSGDKECDSPRDLKTQSLPVILHPQTLGEKKNIRRLC